MAATLTVFTPTYNRASTLGRLYESLRRQTCRDFEWLVVDDGSTDETAELVEDMAAVGEIPIRYIYKENGGLHTGYNTAYATIATELCVCVDSDDWMPDNAVELIIDKWRRDGSDRYCGLVGLDFYADTSRPVAGYFPEGMGECHYLDLYIKNIHKGDSKYVMRTVLMKAVSPMEGFPGERYFNPNYMFLQVGDEYPLLVLNENLCYVDYHSGDNMSADIWAQYADSPRSFAKMRELEMGLRRNDLRGKMRSAVHYVAESVIAGDRRYFGRTRHKGLVALATLPGWLLAAVIKMKTRHKQQAGSET